MSDEENERAVREILAFERQHYPVQRAYADALQAGARRLMLFGGQSELGEAIERGRLRRRRRRLDALERRARHESNGLRGCRACGRYCGRSQLCAACRRGQAEPRLALVANPPRAGFAFDSGLYAQREPPPFEPFEVRARAPYDAPIATDYSYLISGVKE